MRTFIVGDFRTGTGPANVTKEYINHFPKNTLYQKMTGKILRVPELFFKIICSDVILFSGYSAQNVLGMKIAAVFHKPTAYLVHGAIDFENSINHNENTHMSKIEAETFRRADLLLGVSNKFSLWLKNEFPQYEGKIDFVTNGVEFHRKQSSDYDRNSKYVLSIGGGMPRKMITHICKAIEKLNVSKDDDDKYELFVIGNEGQDTETIKAFPFVHYLGLVDAKKKEELFGSCGLFIQNSCFETFGLAVFEALMSGCSILTSNVAGSLDLLPDALDTDVIYHYDDIDELAKKIEYISANPNCDRLKNMINEKEVSWEARSVELQNKLKGLVNGKA